MLPSSDCVAILLGEWSELLELTAVILTVWDDERVFTGELDNIFVLLPVEVLDGAGVVVFELVNDWEGLDEWLGVLEFVDVLVTDADTLGELVKRVLAVSRGELVNLFELVELSLEEWLSDK